MAFWLLCGFGFFFWSQLVVLSHTIKVFVCSLLMKVCSQHLWIQGAVTIGLSREGALVMEGCKHRCHRCPRLRGEWSPSCLGQLPCLNSVLCPICSLGWTCSPGSVLHRRFNCILFLKTARRHSLIYLLVRLIIDSRTNSDWKYLLLSILTLLQNPC